MTDGEEGRGFSVSDRRGRASEPARDQAAAPAAPPPRNAPERGSESAAGPVEFSGFLLSLASTAMIHLGETMPDGRTAPVNVPRAQEMIDLLALLEEKTRGNLTPAESSLLTDLLYTLRLRYVEKAR
ncbi:MAG: DUF1844 domain-containing protein [Nitrospirae bacterium]|nr:DUF1844 domain-containing protein [Nitrospirota bacterium]